MIKFILLGLGSAIGGLFAFAATRPGSFLVERSIRIAAPPEIVYPLIADFRSWPKWSPWEQLDPTMQRTFSGPSVGEDSVYEWDGDRRAGAGRMEIIGAEHPHRIGIALTFIRPFRSENKAEFTLNGDSSTELTWKMSGPATFMTKLMTVFVSMDAMLGKEFEKGLAALKAEAEAVSAGQP